MGLLDGKRLLITGVITDASIAFSVARLAQEQGAQVVLTGFGRMSLVERVAKQAARAAAGDRARRRRTRSTSTRWPTGCASTSTASTACCTRSGSRRRPASAATSWTRRGTTSRPRSQVSTFSLKSLAVATLPLFGDDRRVDRRARLRRPVRLAGLRLDGRGEGRPGVDVALPRPRARPEAHPGQPDRGRAAAHDGGQEHPRLRAVRGRLGRPGAARLGQRGRRAGRAQRRSRCCRTGSRRRPAR